MNLNRAEVRSTDYYYYRYNYKGYEVAANGEQADESKSLSIAATNQSMN